jgi:phage regulator Rha-like protein
VTAYQKNKMQLSVIHKKICEIRGQKVMLDFDLAELYEVETKVLNQAVKRNKDRFPEDFMFQLKKEEWEVLRSQIVTLEKDGRGKYPKYLPFAFTEHGVTMLASVLRSEKAIKMNIAIVRAFIALRQFAINYKELASQIKELRETVDNHNGQLNQIYNALENLLDDKVAQKKWEEREPVGFKSNTKK